MKASKILLRLGFIAFAFTLMGFPGVKVLM